MAKPFLMTREAQPCAIAIDKWIREARNMGEKSGKYLTYVSRLSS